jgi:hypothetical protein
MIYIYLYIYYSWYDAVLLLVILYIYSVLKNSQIAAVVGHGNRIICLLLKTVILTVKL